ncbi:hypothetical protein I3F58_22755 [Streptomyces sp. MUM 203J]|uniref:hypothetical protein n=1 Tax=Streptomyces sp. MUM 203J TaxID=2791990 RepID=UPI001F03A6DE|nr:hypothetical protein [Streptomyces sp. MUM 203J]MCH0542319.1 hypothetical protein [Streptomyces sp. MUM 203J]
MSPRPASRPAPGPLRRAEKGSTAFRVRIATALATLLAGVLTVPATAHAVTPAAAAPPPAVRAAAEHTAGVRTVSVSSTATSLHAPATLAPGIVTFRTTTTDTASGWIGLARPRPGVTWEQFRSTLMKIINAHGPDIVEGSEEMLSTADLLGGTVIYPDRPATFTQKLNPGRYFLFDYRHIRDAQPRYRTLAVEGRPHGSAPGVGAVVTARMTEGAPRYEVTGTVRAGRPLLFRNAMPEGQPAEAIFFPLPDGVTEEELVAWFDKFGDSGRFPEDPGPLGEGPGGLPMSSGVSSVLRLPLQPGRYVIIDWLSSAEDGRMLLKQGHYEIIRVH